MTTLYGYVALTVCLVACIYATFVALRCTPSLFRSGEAAVEGRMRFLTSLAALVALPYLVWGYVVQDLGLFLPFMK